MIVYKYSLSISKSIINRCKHAANFFFNACNEHIETEKWAFSMLGWKSCEQPAGDHFSRALVDIIKFLFAFEQSVAVNHSVACPLSRAWRIYATLLRVCDVDNGQNAISWATIGSSIYKVKSDSIKKLCRLHCQPIKKKKGPNSIKAMTGHLFGFIENAPCVYWILIHDWRMLSWINICSLWKIITAEYLMWSNWMVASNKSVRMRIS